LVEFGFNVSEASLADIEEVGSFGEVLPNQAIEVLNSTFLL